MTDPLGVNLLPASNEWVYDTLPHRAAHLGESQPKPQNRYADASGLETDYSLSIDQLQATYPNCKTVSLVVAWFGNSTQVNQCSIYPSTTFIGGTSETFSGGSWNAEPWQCSGLTQVSPGLIPISSIGGSFVYGGTPSDPSIVRCIRDLKSRGFRVTFYPFILMDCAGYPWRGRITFAGSDISSAASTAVAGWLGGAAASQFTRDATNLTVRYSGSSTDWTFRRMILHYANLCLIAGGVDLFLIGSEFRGLETIRGPGWTKAGTTQADGTVTWDYPFVAGLDQLARDVRGVFDGGGLTRDLAGLHNLIAYSADWSDWMGFQHPGANGQWPHLDQLYASPAIDLVSFDNYLPLSDWTTIGGLDAIYWNAPAPTTWPPTSATMNGLGLSGPPFLASKPYLKANIEGGEKYNWFYGNSNNDGRGFDPNGSAQQVSRPEGDRLTQTRTPFQPGQQILANKMLRWWWANPHQAVYDTGDGQGAVPRGPFTKWGPGSKSITFAEYGFPTCDRCTNQPNVFYDPKSSESFTPFWSTWGSADGGGYRPNRDDTLAGLAREALVEYWTIDGHNTTSAAGLKMIESTFMSAWNWDARPFPVFPQSNNWGDSANWRAGTWIGGKGPSQPPGLTDAGLGLAQTPVRIVEIAEGSDGLLSIVAEEYPGQVGTTAGFAVDSAANVPINRTVAPAPVNPPLILEPPSDLTNDAPQLWVGLSGGSGGIADPNWGGAAIFASTDNATYTQVGTTTGPARQGVLTTALGAPPGAGTDTLTISFAESGASVLAGAQPTLLVVDGEIMSFSSATLTATNIYALGGLSRRRYGQRGLAHAVGAQMRPSRRCSPSPRTPWRRCQAGSTVRSPLLATDARSARAPGPAPASSSHFPTARGVDCPTTRSSHPDFIA